MPVEESVRRGGLLTPGNAMMNDDRKPTNMFSIMKTNVLFRGEKSNIMPLYSLISSRLKPCCSQMGAAALKLC